jgi:DNA-3-methyladenine glycosylase I
MQNSGPRNSQGWVAQTFASQKVPETPCRLQQSADYSKAFKWRSAQSLQVEIGTPSPRSAARAERDSEGRGCGLSQLGNAEFANLELSSTRSRRREPEEQCLSPMPVRPQRLDKQPRCGWAKSDLMIRYHDEEWGTPVHDDRRLLEFLILEGAQAGLSWETILRKRENYRAAFDNFAASAVARYGQRRLRQLLANPGIVRNRLKINSAVQNARALLAVQDEFGSFDAYVWRFVGGKPRVNAWRSLTQVPGHTPESDAMSKDLKQRGFGFVGSTICYAFMQATGMVNDHVVGCFRHAQLKSRGRS